MTDFKKKYLVSSQCDESKFQIEKFFTATARLNQYDFANLIFWIDKFLSACIFNKEKCETFLYVYLFLSEEQSQIESEFSVNKEILTENLQQKSLES